MKGLPMKFSGLLLILLMLFVTKGLLGQTRAMAQDPSLDNLKHAPGTKTALPGTLGEVRRLGAGPRTLLLIPGLGFGADIWTEFMERHRSDFTMLAITLPGFGETAPLPMPDESRFAETPWTRSIITSIEKLLNQERISRVTVVAHWALATQIGLRLALDHPDRIDALVIIGGPLKVYYEASPGMLNWTLEQRSQFVEGMGQRWFKTVTRRTWDDNNFMSYDYAINPRRALFLWREAQTPSLPVWIRYLLEFYSIDPTPSLKNLKIPTLVVQPGFDDSAFYVEKGRDYMRNLCLDSWRGSTEPSDQLHFVTIHNSRLFIMFDQPEELDRVLEGFLREKK
jgi:pimeloyl-ACP methyl ester carboxylesterase